MASANFACPPTLLLLLYRWLHFRFRWQTKLHWTRASSERIESNRNEFIVNRFTFLVCRCPNSCVVLSVLRLLLFFFAIFIDLLIVFVCSFCRKRLPHQPQQQHQQQRRQLPRPLHQLQLPPLPMARRLRRRQRPTVKRQQLRPPVRPRIPTIPKWRPRRYTTCTCVWQSFRLSLSLTHSTSCVHLRVAVIDKDSESIVIVIVVVSVRRLRRLNRLRSSASVLRCASAWRKPPRPRRPRRVSWPQKGRRNSG